MLGTTWQEQRINCLKIAWKYKMNQRGWVYISCLTAILNYMYLCVEFPPSLRPVPPLVPPSTSIWYKIKQTFNSKCLLFSSSDMIKMVTPVWILVQMNCLFMNSWIKKGKVTGRVLWVSLFKFVFYYRWFSCLLDSLWSQWLRCWDLGAPWAYWPTPASPSTSNWWRGSQPDLWWRVWTSRGRRWDISHYCLYHQYQLLHRWSARRSTWWRRGRPWPWSSSRRCVGSRPP